MKNRKVLILKILLFIVVFIIIGYILYKFFPHIHNITTKEGQLEFKEMLDNLGFKGGLLLFGLQVLQIILIILPGEPLEVLAGMCYGAVGGTLFITFSVFVTTSLIYFLVYKYGKNFIYNFFSKERIDKIENSKIFKNPKKVELIMCILFFIPGSPKDLFVYIGGLLPIKPLRFILISTFARFPSVITSCIAGSNITKGNWETSLIIYIVTFVLTGLFIYIINKNNKTSAKVVKILK